MMIAPLEVKDLLESDGVEILDIRTARGIRRRAS